MIMANAICLLFDMCRLCLDEPGAYDIFEDHIMIHDILLCTGIPEIISMDNLPPKICSTCMCKIKAAKDLRQYSIKNDLYMKSLLDGNSNFAHKIARPRIPLGQITPLENAGMVTPLEEAVVRKPTISVRSLAAINATQFSELSSTDKDETSRENKLSESSSPEDTKTESNNKPEMQCFTLSENTGTSAKTFSHTTITTGDCGKQKCDSSSDKDGISRKKKLSESSSPEDIKRESNNKPEMKCHCSSGTSEKKMKTTISTGDCGEHKCDICQKIYSTSKKLYLHRRSHSKKLYCPLDACGKKFATKGDLQKHIRSHTGEKPYECDLCDKSFTQNVTLKSHKEVVHLEKT